MNRFTIENKNKFCRYFLEPLLKLNPKCVLKIEPDKVQAKSSYPDGSLFLEASSSIDTDIKDQKELAFIDLSRFIKTLDFVQKDVSNYFPSLTYGLMIKKGKILHPLLQEFMNMLQTEKLLKIQN